MDRESVARAAGVIPEAKLAAFLEYLVRKPERPELCDVPHPTEERLQGDLIRELPFCIVNPTGEARVASLMVAVINNTCDLQPGRSKLVNIALAFDYQKFRASIIASRGEASAKSFLHSVESNRVSEIFFVRNCPGFDEGVVILLDNLASISADLYEKALSEKRRVASFTQNGFFVFLLKIANYFARAETPDVDRVQVAN